VHRLGFACDTLTGSVRGNSQEERPKACWQRLIQRTIAKPGKKGMHKGKGAGA